MPTSSAALITPRMDSTAHAQIYQARLLVVDDDEAVRRIVAELLQEEGYEPAIAASAEEALELLSKNQFELVISDIKMPGADGLALLRNLRESHPETAVIMMTGFGQIESAVEALKLGASDYLTKPVRLAALTESVLTALNHRFENLEAANYQKSLEGDVASKTRELEQAYAQINETYKLTLEALVTALDARECETGHHSQRVVKYSLAIGQKLGLSTEELEQLARGALLHDIGKIGVPDSILLKPGPLTDDEWVEMKKHPEIGARILSDIEFLQDASEIVMTHQEQWNGDGYPAGLTGEDIPLGSRIFAVADALDAIVSDRPYRKGRSLSYAREEIERYAGRQFDPQVVQAFLSLTDEEWISLREEESIYRTKD
ncbi:MAG: HD domain-containing phosphohydrolase [Myxococcota bacterium]|nr:HD domain-containing phosphohydrolase [Myxococcota bacterium]